MVNINPKESTRFKPGVSGNPGGRPKEVGEVRELARKHSAEAIERLLHWLRSKDPRASVAAANALLDRGYGKAPQQIELDANVRHTDVSVNPLTAEEWVRTYGTPVGLAKAN